MSTTPDGVIVPIDTASVTDITARRIILEGLVQGVGFRPFVHRLAVRHGLAGYARNLAQGVEIMVEGGTASVAKFLNALTVDAPVLARIDNLQVESIEPTGCGRFEIAASSDGGGFQPIAPDIATCPDCLREVLSPTDRRFGYPFTNCTNCGPRFTIIEAVPYDRQNTTMAGFTMCARCRAEYDDPTNRRFHAQPNACPQCGPSLRLVDCNGTALPGDAMAETRRFLAAGSIVAIKGIGGFHLACDALNDVAVKRLRERKGREAKPFALMVADVAAAERICDVSDAERALLCSRARPIVLLRERSHSQVARSVAPGLGRLGVMLSYSPLHHLLFSGEIPRALVMTSGNRSDEPMATNEADALKRLGTIADAFLLHDRPIHLRCDDSVTRVVDGVEMPLRRSRGYAPFPVSLPFDTRPTLALGADLKNTVCVSRGAYAFLSSHIGDLEDWDTFASFKQMIGHMKSLFRVEPEIVVHDLHPDYFSTRYAREIADGTALVAVQHHHAHIAACMAEHRLSGPVIGVAFDGTGLGIDDCVWGGEFLLADYADFTRMGHLKYVPMPGGNRAVREPFRMALAHLMNACGRWDAALPPVRESKPEERKVIARQIEQRLNAPLTSSMGRLFDAIASMLGVRHRAAYEAQAAMELEALIDPSADGSYPFEIAGERPAVIDPAPIVRAVVAEMLAGTPVPVIASRFHTTVANLIVEMCGMIRGLTGENRVVLSGGVFQNVVLLRSARRGLAEAGFEVFTHNLVPPNDGGIALGQVAVAHARMAGSTESIGRRSLSARAQL